MYVLPSTRPERRERLVVLAAWREVEEECEPAVPIYSGEVGQVGHAGSSILLSVEADEALGFVALALAQVRLPMMWELGNALASWAR